MEKKYVKPAVMVQTIDIENTLLAGSGLASTPTNLVDNNAPGNKGDSDGSQSVGAKQHTFDIWDNEE